MRAYLAGPTIRKEGNMAAVEQKVEDSPPGTQNLALQPAFGSHIDAMNEQLEVVAVIENCGASRQKASGAGQTREKMKEVEQERKTVERVWAEERIKARDDAHQPTQGVTMAMHVRPVRLLHSQQNHPSAQPAQQSR